MAFIKLLKHTWSGAASRKFLSSWTGRIREDIQDLPANVDWRKAGVLPTVRNQGEASSCWAFAVAQAIEARYKIITRSSILVSKQELLDCCKNYDIHGGFTYDGYSYVFRNGISLESDYPYDERHGLPCRRKWDGKRVWIHGFAHCEPNDLSLMKVLVKQPISVGLCAGIEHEYYTKGHIYDRRVCHDVNDKGILEPIVGENHDVLLVGYGSRKGKDYWIIMNFWGDGWGDEGFMLLRRNHGGKSGQCGILKHAWYPIMLPDNAA